MPSLRPHGVCQANELCKQNPPPAAPQTLGAPGLNSHELRSECVVFRGGRRMPGRPPPLGPLSLPSWTGCRVPQEELPMPEARASPIWPSTVSNPPQPQSSSPFTDEATEAERVTVELGLSDHTDPVQTRPRPPPAAGLHPMGSSDRPQPHPAPGTLLCEAPWLTPQPCGGCLTPGQRCSGWLGVGVCKPHPVCISLESSPLRGTWASPPRKYSLCRTTAPHTPLPSPRGANRILALLRGSTGPQRTHRALKTHSPTCVSSGIVVRTTRGWARPKDMLLPYRAASPGPRGTDG